MRKIGKVIFSLVITSLIFTTTSCSTQNSTNDFNNSTQNITDDLTSSIQSSTNDFTSSIQNSTNDFTSSTQNITEDNEQASGDNSLNPILLKAEQKQNDENAPIRITFEVLSEESIHDNLNLTDNCVYFSWMDFITPEQLEIAREYLGIPEGVFDDNALVVHAITMDRELLRHYDSIPFEDMPEDPIRIVVRMYEAHCLMHMELRKKSALELGISEPDYIVAEFGRVITDWR